MMYMRHEAGHVFNYAYRLYTTPSGATVRPFLSLVPRCLSPGPFSRNFVTHIEGWYAQKHPDEDFAESLPSG